MRPRQVTWLVLIVGLLFVFACGGRASRSTLETAEAGAAGTGGASSASAGAMAGGGGSGGAGGAIGAAGSSEAPGIVTLHGASGDAAAPATPTMIGPCFVGFVTFVEGMQIEFEAYVQEPGDYQGDPLHILYLAAQLADGRTFSASTNSQPYGEINLHAVAVSPRFSGAVSATLYDRDDPSAPPLAMSLSFDLKGSTGCGR